MTIDSEAVLPIAHSVSDIYPENSISTQSERFKLLLDRFQELYGRRADFVVRSPGRVNIIGEHIDYAGFPVFPMAIERDCLIAVAAEKTSTPRVELANIVPKYHSSDFAHVQDTCVDIDSSLHDWSNYFKAGYKGMHEAIKTRNPASMYCLVDGIVPGGAGLSSSSALVCSAAMATMIANNYDLPKQKIVQIAVESERYVGTNGGGMDQTASIMSTSNNALFIEFSPTFNTTPIRFPRTQPPLSFVVANTLVVADKVVSSPICYNLRVVETRIGAQLMGKELGLTEYKPQTFKEAMDAYFKVNPEPSDLGETARWIHRLSAMLELVEKVFSKRGGYTKEETATALGITPDELTSKFMTKFPVRAELFQLYLRAKHVYSEALRVVKFRDICEVQFKAAVVDSESTFNTLGELMNESQSSCKENFDCSCPELDELTALCRKQGAVGSRLTGAGWGGCTVSLVREDQVEGFISNIKLEYYGKRFPDLSDSQLDDFIFPSRPSTGAYVYREI
ncbi:galactokinase [Basidiobolus meristosporus CBS 931.73]|uniref:Galactokinase n=1 Tax=Basidiobolus meristosporus CBS 931.73 TaxID=1314790 RepID=A0A1Y1XE52_9FUNG|nr:galactokinase [Basidiobolus meristosporus CBS 931.73]|eukprot:ORX84003.1 galactokinase [Basidiobolus meristosporus CBS 931.73]